MSLPLLLPTSRWGGGAGIVRNVQEHQPLVDHLWPHVAGDTSPCNPDNIPLCRGGTSCREVKSCKKHISFIWSWPKAGKQIQTSRWHILDPKRFRQAGNGLSLRRHSLLGLFSVPVLGFKNISTQMEDGVVWEEKTLGPRNESPVFCVCQRGW